MRLKIVTATMLAISSGSAFAQNCEDPQTQLEMNHCAGLAYEAADERLNETYGEVRARLDEAGREQLVATQRAWIAFRDTECTFRSRGVEGGTIYGMVYSGCLADLTDQRTADFEEMLACPEGDLSCPF
ncbi:MAG: DUF1311 domain-containing protein [Rhizobiaceae bacterium]|nr:DUF1311 domain-containing protein [Rhizobiaceae bacterium]